MNFCGGRGSNTIIRSLVSRPHVRLTNVVNAYDDGKSTGTIRRFFRMLGPSDLRKNQVVLMGESTPEDRAVKALFEFRFPVGTTPEAGRRALAAIRESREDEFGLWLHMKEIDPPRRRKLTWYLAAFEEFGSLYGSVMGEEFPYDDCSLANCAYAGALERHDRDFGLAVNGIGKLLNMRAETIPNSLENLYLIGIREDGTIMNSEAEIVESRTNVRLRDIFTVPRTLGRREKENLDRLPMEQKIAFLSRLSVAPTPSARCVEAIREADVILYSPGTQHSSLYPTYMTRGLGGLIRANRQAVKVMVANIGEDYETPAYSVSELVTGALRRLMDSDVEKHPAGAYIGTVLANSDRHAGKAETKYIRFDPREVEATGVSCIGGSFEDPNQLGKHDGDAVVGAVLALADRYLGD